MVRRWLAAGALILSLSPRPCEGAEKRPLPDYDGRPAPGEHAAWWIPRIGLAPLWLVHEYAVRKPLGAVVLVFDRNAAEGGATRDRFDVRPLFELDLGFKPRFGMQVTGKHEHMAVRARFDTFGPTSFRLGGAALLIGEPFSGEIYGEITRRPDTIFHGIGPSTTPGARVRVALERGDVGARLHASPATWSSVDAGLSLRGVEFRTPGVAQDYAAFAERLAITLSPGPFRFEADAELAQSPLPMRSWISYGGVASAAFDVTGRERILEVGTTARFVDELSGGTPTYTELATLGGDKYLRGHLQGRLYGQSAFVAYAEWRWPVWTFLDGFVRVDTGNVFSTHMTDFAPRLFRLSATGGMRNVGTSGYVFELMSGVGTEPIADGARVSSVRVLFSATQPL